MNGPFDARELISGFWMLNGQGHEEAVQRACRVPFRPGAVELRRVYEAEDSGESFTPELQAQEQEFAPASPRRRSAQWGWAAPPAALPTRPAPLTPAPSALVYHKDK